MRKINLYVKIVFYILNKAACLLVSRIIWKCYKWKRTQTQQFIGMVASLLPHKKEQPNSMCINKDWLQDSQ